MAPKWVRALGKAGSVGLTIAGKIIPQVAAVEALARSLPGLKGQAKQDAVIALVMESLEATEELTDKDLLNDADVQKAMRGVTDAVVALENIIAAKRAQQAAAAVEP